MNVPSYSVDLGDAIAVREKSKSLKWSLVLYQNGGERCEYEWNPDTMTGKLAAIPERSQIPENIKEQLIVELYSK